MPGPTIVSNALALRVEGSGVQTYIRELLGALRAATTADLAAIVQQDATSALPPGVRAIERPVSSGARRALHGLRPVEGADLVHGLDVDVPLRSAVPLVATVHDLSVFDVPWTMSRGRATAERMLVGRALRRADVLLAVSSFTAERILARTGRVATVVLEGPPTDLAPAPPDEIRSVVGRLALPERFVLHVGTVEPRKNLGVLADACRAVGVPLVLAGATPRPAWVPAHATTLGYLDRADLAALYGAATLVAYPSSYEGFGLPPLEAMACGAPVLATRASALPEVLGTGAELVVDGVGPWTAALRELLADEERRAELAGAGRRWVAGGSGLSWARAAAETLEVYRSVGVDAG